MAKGNGNKDSEVTVDAGKPGTLTVADKRKLMDAYNKANEAVKAAGEAFDKATELRSEAVSAIYDACGAGPFKHDGKLLSIRKRGPTEKNPDAKVTAYFVEHGSSNIQEI